jgi:hypothetical protein
MRQVTTSAAFIIDRNLCTLYKLLSSSVFGAADGTLDIWPVSRFGPGSARLTR